MKMMIQMNKQLILDLVVEPDKELVRAAGSSYILTRVMFVLWLKRRTKATETGTVLYYLVLSLVVSLTP